MAAPSTEGRRGLTPFRLSDVPETVRRRYGMKLADIAQESADAWGMIQMTRAIDTPSDRVYWIPTEAWQRESAKRTWR